jgi:hypothetical protein
MVMGGWLSLGRWVSTLVARLLATAALWVRIQSRLLSKIQNCRHKQRSCQHTLARQKILKYKNQQPSERDSSENFILTLWTVLLPCLAASSLLF